MKRNITIISTIVLLFIFFSSSCSNVKRATKKDCRGKTKHRLSNGIYM